MKAKRPHHKRPKRIGRGAGSGHGKTSTKGHKGQRSRSGFSQRPDFEGGQNPLYRRVPKRGFNHPSGKTFAILNLDQLVGLGMDQVNPTALIERGIIKKLMSGLKILGRGKLTQSLTVEAHGFSTSAKDAIEKAGGKAILIGSPVKGDQPESRN